MTIFLCAFALITIAILIDLDNIRSTVDEARTTRKIMLVGDPASFDDREDLRGMILDDLYPKQIINAERFAEDIPANLADGLRFRYTPNGIMAVIDPSTN